jgi:WD40 repeat protein
LQSILVAYLEAVEAGHAPGRNELLARHSELAAELAEFLDNRERIARAAAPLCPARPSPSEVATVAPGEGRTAAPLGKVRYFGDYELLEEIARGGMGVVYKARQVSLDRIVALKMILAGHLASENDLRRFRQEANAAANLDHPNIVPIYEVGEHDGQHYFSMKYITGGSLVSLQECGPRRAAELLAKVSRAVRHAHQRGILHRDLKPGNILLDADGTPHVVDFGLARRVEADQRQTQTGAVVGTPSYMPPEQASGRKDLTTAVDVYSLGAILYELLTSQPPFRGPTPLDTLLQVMEREPLSPRVVKPAVNRDLETICLKCLQKDPDRRYGSTEALAEDLERYLAGEPITARPVGGLERAWRWCRRKPAVAALLLLVGVVAAAGLVGILWAYGEAVEQRQAARKEAENALQEKERALESERQMRQARAEEQAARSETGHAKYVHRMSLAGRGWEADNLTFCREHLEATPPALRGWEYRYLADRVYRLETTLGGSGPVFLTPDGSRIIGMGTVWGAGTGQALFHFDTDQGIVLSPDRARIATFGAKGLWIVDAATGSMVLSLEGKVKEVRGVAYSPDGQRIAAVVAPGVNQPTDGAKVWDAHTGKELVALQRVGQWTTHLAFAPDGRMIALGDAEGAVGLWDSATGQLLHALKKHDKAVTALLFTPGGKRIVSGSDDGTVRGSDTATGKESYLVRNFGRGVTALGLRPDGKRLAAGSQDGMIRLVDPDSGAEIAVLQAQGTSVWSLVFDARGTVLAAGSEGGLVRLFDADRGRLIDVLKGHETTVRSLVFGPDGKRMVSAGDGGVKVWDITGDGAGRSIQSRQTNVRSVRFSPDGMRLVTAGKDKVVKVWDARTGQELFALGGHEPEALGAELTPDGRHIITWSGGNKARVWTADTGKPVITYDLKGGPNYPVVSLSPDGRRLLAGHRDTVQVYDALTGKELATHKVPTLELGFLLWSGDGKRIAAVDIDTRKDGCDFTFFDPDATVDSGGVGYRWQYDMVLGAAFSPDGKRSAAAGASGKVNIRDTTTTAEVVELLGHLGSVTCVSYSPDGGRIVTGGADRTVRIWDAASGEELLSLTGHQAEVTSVTFSPDGNSIASADGTGIVKVWEAGRGAPGAFVFRGHALDITTGAFLPDGRHLVTGSYDKTVKVWECHTGREVLTLEGHSSGVTAVAVSRDGTRIVSGDMTGKVKLWDAGGRELGSFAIAADEAIKQFAFSPDADRIAAGGNNGSVRAWSLASGEQLGALQLPEGWKAVVAFSPDCSQVASGDYENGRLRVCDLASGKEVWSIAAHNGGIWAVLFSPDGSRIISTGRDYRTRMWDARTGKSLGVVTNQWVTSMMWTQDGKRILIIYGGTVQVWDAATMQKPYTMVVPWAGGGAQSCFTPDGSRMADVGPRTIRVSDLPADLPERRRARLQAGLPAK